MKRRGPSLEERMKVSLRRDQVEATGKPLYMGFDQIPKDSGLVTKTGAKKLDRPVRENEDPVAYVLSRNWNGYLPLYDRK